MVVLNLNVQQQEIKLSLVLLCLKQGLIHEENFLLSWYYQEVNLSRGYLIKIMILFQ